MSQPNYFDLMLLPQSYNIDLDQLETNYFNIQRQYHPDVLAKKDAMERAMGVQLATTANQAYNTLKDPLKRAVYMLSLHDRDLEKARPDQSLLMQSMEQREQLMEAESEDDFAKLRAMNDEQVKQCKERLVEAFANDDVGAAEHNTMELKYLLKFAEELRAREKSS